MWKVHKRNFNPIQPTYELINDEAGATPTTDYRKADALARKLFGRVSFEGHGYTFWDNKPIRYYASQNY